MNSATLRDIAATVGVSERLVAYALSGKGRVGAQTRQRILDEAQRLGYRANRAARALVTGRSNLLALCLPPTGTAYCDRITRLVEENARPSVYDLVVTRMTSHPETGETIIVPPGLGQMDGVLIVEPPRMLTDDDLAGHGHSVVMGVWPGAAPLGSDVVRVNLLPAARKAMELLRERKPSRLAYLGGISTVFEPGETRFSAYLDGVREMGQLPILIQPERAPDLIAASDTALFDYVRRNPRPDALLCSNDEVATGALRAIRRLGLHAPTDIAVIGCDDIEFARDLNPPLSTIAQPFEKMVAMAWEFLMQRIDDPRHEPRQVELDAHLVKRESA
ncbi:MAG: LacI family DNA-binding transcriptional regulator [Capsulimonadaceae bacterium]|nr:LacI family DNA-binding transcriptional regulator [Capsulimonadaceae bacterium]